MNGRLGKEELYFVESNYLSNSVNSSRKVAMKEDRQTIISFVPYVVRPE